MSFERLADAIETIRAAIAELDVDVVSPAEAAGLVSSFAEVERLCAGARTVLARSAVDAEEVWRPTGATSGVDWLARRLGCTRQGARHVVDRSNHLGSFREVTARCVPRPVVRGPARPGPVRRVSGPGC